MIKEVRTRIGFGLAFLFITVPWTWRPFLGHAAVYAPVYGISAGDLSPFHHVRSGRHISGEGYPLK